MSKRPNPTLIGAFVIGGSLLALVAVAVWGSGRLFERRYHYVCYFEGSVNGLSVGAPVKYRGVPVGVVRSMRVADPRQNPRIAVRVDLLGKRIRAAGGSEDPSPDHLRELVALGMRARLESQSFVTGQLFVSLDLFPDSPVRLVQPAGQAPPEIPTVPSQTEKLVAALSSLEDQVVKLDLPEVTHSLTRTLDTIGRFVSNGNLRGAVNALPAAVRSFDRVMGSLDDTAHDASGTLVALRKSVGNVEASIAPEAPLAVDVERTLADVRKAAQSVQALAEFLQQNPNALIVGKKH